MQSRIIPEFLINYNLKCLRIKIKKVNTFCNTFTFLNFSSVQIYLICFLLRYDGIKLNHIAAIDNKFRAFGVFCVSDEIPYRVSNIRPFRNRVNGESPVSISETDKKKRSSYKISPIRFGAANRNCKEQNDNHTQ